MAAYIVVPSQGLGAYAHGKVPQLRNPETYGDVDSPEALEAYQEKKRAYKAQMRAKQQA